MLLNQLLNQYLAGTGKRPKFTSPSLTMLRNRAAKLGVTIEIDRDANGRCYWLNGTGWDDGNFCADHEEIASSLDQLARERAAKA
jgi:hypothetical protein